MEVVHQERRIRREMSNSPEKGNGNKVCVHHQAKAKARARGIMKASFKKVQVVYYLSRNGNLEHPHYLELTHLSHQPLLLKDFMDKLTMLRGKGMPSLYSWSCKRNYKMGYVWNDVVENDVMYPSEGSEYVLKGSELIDGCTEKLNHLQVNNGEPIPPMTNRQSGPDTNFQPKRSQIASTRMREPEEMANHFRDEEGKVEEEQEFEYEEKTGYASSATPRSRRSMGVSTDDIQEFKPRGNHKNTPVEFNSYSSPPSTTSSTSLSDKAINETTTSNNNISKRFEDGDPVSSEPLLNRNSMLLSLIACGGSGSFRKPVPPPSPQPVVARKSVSTSGSLHKGVVCKAAATKVAVEEDEATMIVYMSENPRFGNLQSEEKEYFSGSIVESMTNEDRLAMDEPSGLKKSSSYNEERSRQTGLAEVEVEVEKEVKKDKGAKGKCIPRIMF